MGERARVVVLVSRVWYWCGGVARGGAHLGGLVLTIHGQLERHLVQLCAQVSCRVLVRRASSHIRTSSTDLRDSFKLMRKQSSSIKRRRHPHMDILTWPAYCKRSSSSHRDSNPRPAKNTFQAINSASAPLRQMKRSFAPARGRVAVASAHVCRDAFFFL
jgi:hypothetical protein